MRAALARCLRCKALTEPLNTFARTEYIAAACGGEGWMYVETVSEYREQHRHHETPAEAGRRREKGRRAPANAALAGRGAR